jgi:hypothetical protein
MPHAVHATLISEKPNGARLYRTTFSDGRVLVISVPGPECRACGGERRAWNGHEFTEQACLLCRGTGDAR